MGMVVHTKRHKNQRPDPTESPAIGVKAGFQRPLLEQFQYLVPLVSRQLRWPARDSSIFQTASIALMPRQALGPSADGHPTDAELPRNVGLGELANLQQPSCLEAAFFTLCLGEVAWSPYHGHLL
jgi:hypothetical protein